MADGQAPQGFSVLTTVSEAVANMRAGKVRAAVLIVAAVVTGIGVASAVIMDVSGIEERWDDQVAAGRFVWQVEAGGQGELDAGVCDALNLVEGIEGAGAVVTGTGEGVTSPLQPALTYDVTGVTPGFVSVMWPDYQGPGPAAGGVLAGSVVTERFGLLEGSYFVGEGRDPLPVAGTLPPARNEAFDRRLVSVVPAEGTTDRCVVEAAPSHARGVDQVLVGWFSAAEDDRALVRSFLDPDVLGRSPETELDERPSAWAWAVGAGALGLVSLVLWWARRGDFALYGLLGMTRTRVALMLAVEHLTLVLVPVQAGYLAGVLWMHSRGLDGPAGTLAVLDDLRLVLVSSVVPLAGLAILRSKPVLDILKGF